MMSDEAAQGAFRRLWWVAMAGGLLLIVNAGADLALAIHPAVWDSAHWRFGAVGLLTARLAPVILGVLLVVAAAVQVGARGVIAVSGVLAMVAAMAFSVLLLGFALDGLQVRGTVVEQGMRTFHLAVVRVSVLLGGCAILAGWLGLVLLRMVRRRRAADRAPGSIVINPAEPVSGPR